PDLADLQHAVVAPVLGVEAADQALAFEQGEDVIAPAALRRRNERLEAVVETEETQGAVAVAQDGVERAQDAQARRRGRQGGGALFPIRQRVGTPRRVSSLQRGQRLGEDLDDLSRL